MTSLVDELNIDQIDAIHRVHRATAARWLAGARERIRDATLDRTRVRLKVDEPDIDSIMRLVNSQLDASLRRALEPTL